MVGEETRERHSSPHPLASRISFNKWVREGEGAEDVLSIHVWPAESFILRGVCRGEAEEHRHCGREGVLIIKILISIWFFQDKILTLRYAPSSAPVSLPHPSTTVIPTHPSTSYISCAEGPPKDPQPHAQP